MVYPLLSIIIPVYNVEHYVAECLEDVLRQNFIDFEIILIDDGSIDKTGEICDQYAVRDSRIHVFHRKNKGVSSARNFGIVQSVGKFISFVDGDDGLSSDIFSLLIKNIKLTCADISACDFFQWDGSAKFDASKNAVADRKVCFSRDALCGFYDVFSFASSVWGKIYRKSLIKNIWFDEKLKHNEDYLFNYHAFSRANLVVFDTQKKYYYRNNAFSVSRAKFTQKILWDVLFVKKQILTDIQKRNSSFFCEAFKVLLAAQLSFLQKIIRDRMVDSFTNEYKCIIQDIKTSSEKKRCFLGTSLEFRLFLILNSEFCFVVATKLFYFFIQRKRH